LCPQRSGWESSFRSITLEMVTVETRVASGLCAGIIAVGTDGFQTLVRRDCVQRGPVELLNPLLPFHRYSVLQACLKTGQCQAVRP
jgi:hypothetical protein